LSTNHGKPSGRRGSYLTVLALNDSHLPYGRERWMALTKPRGRRIIQGQHRQRHVASAPVTPASQAPDTIKPPRSPGRVPRRLGKSDGTVVRLHLRPWHHPLDASAAAQMGLTTRSPRERDPWPDTAAGPPARGVRRPGKGSAALPLAMDRLSSGLRTTTVWPTEILRRLGNSPALRRRHPSRHRLSAPPSSLLRSADEALPSPSRQSWMPPSYICPILTTRGIPHRQTPMARAPGVPQAHRGEDRTPRASRLASPSQPPPPPHQPRP